MGRSIKKIELKVAADLAAKKKAAADKAAKEKAAKEKAAADKAAKEKADKAAADKAAADKAAADKAAKEKTASGDAAKAKRVGMTLANWSKLSATEKVNKLKQADKNAALKKIAADKAAKEKAAKEAAAKKASLEKAAKEKAAKEKAAKEKDVELTDRQRASEEAMKAAAAEAAKKKAAQEKLAAAEVKAAEDKIGSITDGKLSDWITGQPYQERRDWFDSLSEQEQMATRKALRRDLNFEPGQLDPSIKLGLDKDSKGVYRDDVYTPPKEPKRSIFEDLGGGSVLSDEQKDFLLQFNLEKEGINATTDERAKILENIDKISGDETVFLGRDPELGDLYDIGGETTTLPTNSSELKSFIQVKLPQYNSYRANNAGVLQKKETFGTPVSTQPDSVNPFQRPEQQSITGYDGRPIDNPYAAKIMQANDKLVENYLSGINSLERPAYETSGLGSLIDRTQRGDQLMGYTAQTDPRNEVFVGDLARNQLQDVLSYKNRRSAYPSESLALYNNMNPSAKISTPGVFDRSQPAQLISERRNVVKDASGSTPVFSDTININKNVGDQFKGAINKLKDLF